MTKYIQNYPQSVIDDVTELIKSKKLNKYLEKKYPKKHNITSDKMLFKYTNEIKNEYLKKYQLSKVIYDSKINIVNNALGLHTFISRVQGNKLKAKNEIRISHIFKNAPKEFLEMIVVHELAHLKIKDHNKAFYNLCQHILPNYGQLEFDLRLYLINKDLTNNNYYK